MSISHKLVSAVLASASLILFPLPVSADEITLTFTGTISPWTSIGGSPPQFVIAPTIDSAGLFGPAGASLSNDPFTVVWQANSDCPLCGGFPNDGYMYGPGGSGGGMPITSATLTINGHSVAFGANGYVDATVNSSPGYILASMTVDPGSSVGLTTFIQNGAGNYVLPQGWQSFTYTFNPKTDNLCGVPCVVDSHQAGEPISTVMLASM
jgi:hypothetical protein